MNKQPKEADQRWGVDEKQPTTLKPFVTVRQFTQVYTGKDWFDLGKRYSEIPTLALKKEIEEYILTGKQKTMKDRMDRYNEVANLETRKKKKVTLSKK